MYADGPRRLYNFLGMTRVGLASSLLPSSLHWTHSLADISSVTVLLLLIS